LVARIASVARRTAAAPLPPAPAAAVAENGRPLSLAFQLFRAGRAIRVKPAPPLAPREPDDRSAPEPAEAAAP
jgi:hypothetical protein